MQIKISAILLTAAVVLSVFGFQASAATSSDTTSDCLQEQAGTLSNTNSLTVSFNGPPAAGNTVVLMLAYGNKANRKKFTITGMGTTWKAGYAPPLKKGFGMAFFYGAPVDGIGESLTITAPQNDNLVAVIQEWTNLSTVEDTRAHKIATKNNAAPTITVHTKNANDIIFNTVLYGGLVPPQSSPPTGAFLFHGNAGNTFAPVMQGGYVKTITKGKYTNIFNLQSPTIWVSFATAVKSTGTNQLFTSATPLTDFALGQLYQGAYHGHLYPNDQDVDSGPHDADGQAIAKSLVPLDLNGNPSPDGKIVMVTMGPSNWTEEMCTATPITPSTGTDICDPNTFFDQAEKQMTTLFPGKMLNPNLLLVNCAKGGAFIDNWLDITSTYWTACEDGPNGDIMNAYHTSQAQVQIVAFMDDDKGGTGTLSGATCPPNPSFANGDPNACVYEFNLGNWVRLVKQQFPNLRMIFLQSRPYAGYASKEPLPYETGFSVKWLIEAQIDQRNGAGIDPLAGDLSYSVNGAPAVAPWLGWAAYTWGPGPIPRADGNTWPGGNFAFDGVHPSKCNYASPWTYCGRGHDAHLMMEFYTSSAYTTPWFLQNPSP